jgi:RimJ/RimL family protein N-acetyltransferase
MSIGNISEHDKRAEIGWSWLGKDFRGTDLNRHAKFSMIRWLIEDNHFERVEFKTDVLNERAKNGLRKIGGTEEGVLRSHIQMWNNRRRDSVYFSILKSEWEDIRNRIYKDIVG